MDVCVDVFSLQDRWSAKVECASNRPSSMPQGFDGIFLDTPQFVHRV